MGPLPAEAGDVISVCWHDKPIVMVDEAVPLADRAALICAEVQWMVQNGYLPDLTPLLPV